MQRSVRWLVAALVMVAAFAVPTWMGGTLVLPSILQDPAIRWMVASAAGGALAALAALWGHSFATHSLEEGTAQRGSGPLVQASGARAVAIGGSNKGSIITGDTQAPHLPANPPTRPSRASRPRRPTLGMVSASGQRTVAIGGNNSAPITTGDHSPIAEQK